MGSSNNFFFLTDAFNVTIKGNMKTSEIKYAITPSTVTKFTTLIAQFVPLTCTANIMAPLAAMIVATSFAMVC